MNVFYEFSKIVKELEDLKIQYALVGGVAMAFHAEMRFTKDIDILLDPNDLEKIRKILKKEGYFESSSPWTFKQTPLTLHRFLKVQDNEEMVIDVMIGKTKRHSMVINNALEAESNEGVIRVAAKKDLIWMKRFRNSKQDQADIEKLENETN